MVQKSDNERKMSIGRARPQLARRGEGAPPKNLSAHESHELTRMREVLKTEPFANFVTFC
ncbi:MAG: hypothetical protein DME64_05775 [Verrucomicrobia bacterium]|nr:MAG: hypothetical protein DME64_05775 [Verrucomicrobiota bacterium]